MEQTHTKHTAQSSKAQQIRRGAPHLEEETLLGSHHHHRHEYHPLHSSSSGFNRPKPVALLLGSEVQTVLLPVRSPTTKDSPSIVVFDNACKLHAYCLNRNPDSSEIHGSLKTSCTGSTIKDVMMAST